MAEIRPGWQLKGAGISLAGGWIEVASIIHPPGEVVVSVRPVGVFTKGPGSEIEQVCGDLHGRAGIRDGPKWFRPLGATGPA